VLGGHDHDYERFAPQDPNGKADAARGIREFVVGTGGKSHRPFAYVRPNSEVRNNDTYGVLKLTLYPNGYDWQFIPVAGKSFTDTGSGNCH
jgi:acid phosphatase type 7